MWFVNHIYVTVSKSGRAKVLASSDSHCSVGLNLKPTCISLWRRIRLGKQNFGFCLWSFHIDRLGLLLHSGLWNSWLMKSYASYTWLFFDMTQCALLCLCFELQYYSIWIRRLLLPVVIFKYFMKTEVPILYNSKSFCVLVIYFLTFEL